MKRIGDICCSVALIIGFWAFASVALAQTSPSVEATVSKNTLPAGARLKLTISISGDFNQVNRPTLPAFSNFQLLNKTPSTSQSIRYINGVSKSSYSYSYYLQAKTAGKVKIPPVSVAVDGKKYHTKAIRIEIQKGNASAKNRKSTEGNSNVFLRLHVSNRHPVTGQQLIANVILYFKQGFEVRSYQPIPGWKAQGFWKEELKDANHPQINSTVINGIRYRSARLIQFALFPTKSGKLTISPYKVRIAVRSTSGGNDPFSNFFGGYGGNQQQVDLKTKPVTINVKALPNAKEANYIGAVGSFQINRKIKNTKVKTGESIEVTTTIKGTGNIPLINKPNYKFPPALEIYQPEENSNINRGHHRISGEKTYTEVAIANKPGVYTIPAAKLAYFNPAKNKYITKNLPARRISVKRNPNAAPNVDQPHALSVEPITGLASWVSPAAHALYSYWWFWVGLLFPVVVFGLAFWQKTYINKMTTDRNFARAQKASKTANDRLEQALHLGEEAQFKQAYNVLQKALTGFIGDRCGLAEAGLSIQQYVAELQAHEVDTELVKNVRILLNKCATINYAPDSSQDYLKSHVGLAESIIQKLKKEL